MSNLVGLVLVTSMVVGQEGIPESARKALEYSVGDWIGDWKYGDDVGRNKLSVKWSPTNHCTIIDLDVNGTLKGEKIHVRGAILAGWQPDKKQIVETNFSSNGVVVRFKASDICLS